MANEDIEFDIKINGKDAKKSIQDVEKEQDKLAKNTDENANAIKQDWKKIGAQIAAASVAVVEMIYEAGELDKLMFGLSSETKQYIRESSEFYGLSQEIIAGFVRTGQSAGQSADQIKKMVDQAVALGRAYPNESIESFVDNIRQFNSTGEVSGFLMDVLEDHFKSTEVQTFSFTKKVKGLEEATKGINKRFKETKGAELDRTFISAKNAFDDFGTLLLDAVSSAGALWLVDKFFKTIAISINGFQLALTKIKLTGSKIFGLDTAKKNLKEFQELLAKNKKLLDGLLEDTTLSLGTIDVVGLGKTKDELAKLRELSTTANDAFWDEYNQSNMSTTEFELTQLNERYTKYDKYVTDKVALEEWFKSEQERILKEANKANDKYESLRVKSLDRMSDALADFVQNGKIDFKSLADSMISDLLRIQAKEAVTGLFGNNGSGGVVGSFLGGIGGVTGFFADGGEVQKTGSYVVGERGAEIVNLQKGSHVTPNNKIGGDTNLKINVNNYGNDEVTVQQNENGIDVIIAKISDDIRRGTGSVGSAIETTYNLRKA